MKLHKTETKQVFDIDANSRDRTAQSKKKLVLSKIISLVSNIYRLTNIFIPRDNVQAFQ